MAKFADLFKRTAYISIQNQRQTDMADQEQAPEIPENMWQKCPSCGSIVYTEDVESNLKSCPSCGYYFKMGARERLAIVLDGETFEEWGGEQTVRDPLNFPGYKKKINAQRKRTGLKEGIIIGQGKIFGIETAIGVMDTAFMMGSMGTVLGELVTFLFEEAARRRLPVIIFTCSGGARMQEGILSLMQMAKTAQAVTKLSEAGQPYFAVLTDPTTGGVTASFAMLGDVILAEPGALIGFAGPRVIEQTIGERLPDGFQRAEFQQEHGFVDAIVKREELKNTLRRLLIMHGKEAVECGQRGTE